MNHQDNLLEDSSTEITPERLAIAKRSTWVSAAVNVLLTIGQVITGLFAGSQALIADGIHSLSDLVSDFLVLWASHHGQKAPDEKHPFGHQRFENLASMALGALLVLVGVGMVYSGVIKLQAPEKIPVVHIHALWAAIAALIIKETLFRYMLRIAESVRSSLLIANAWHARSDAASSLVVAVGIVGNLLGFTLLDPIAALIVGIMVGRTGWNFMWDAVHALTDRAASRELVHHISQQVLATPGVQGVHDLRTRKTGDMVLVEVHLEVDGSLTVRQGHDIAVAVSQRIMALPQVLDVVTHVDPV
jgi:cation diffusion facilitator family transporter